MKPAPIRHGLIALSLALSPVALPARADAVSDATAGLQALDQGDTKTAVRLFTQAIESGSLSQSDLEYAYVERGNAYLQRHEPDHARRDADQALRLKPGDQDAVTLWNQTTIDAQPGVPDEGSPTAITYNCKPASNPNSTVIVTLEIDYDKRTVKSQNNGEIGRKLDMQFDSAIVSWKSHIEGVLNNNRIFADHDWSLNTKTGILVHNYRNQSGVSGVNQFLCHAGD